MSINPIRGAFGVPDLAAVSGLVGELTAAVVVLAGSIVANSAALRQLAAQLDGLEADEQPSCNGHCRPGECAL